MDNAGLCRFHRAWGEEMMAEAVGSVYGLKDEYLSAVSVAASRINSRNAAVFWESQADVDFDAISVAAPAAAAPVEDLLALDDALSRLEREAPRLAQTVEWHFFGGLTFSETAEATGVSRGTVQRDWRAARALLHIELASPG